MSSSRYDGVGFGSMSLSYHQERASPRFVSVTSRHYPGSNDRLHRLSSPSSAAALSSSSRYSPLANASPRSSPAPSSTAVYAPKRSVSYTSGLSLGEGGERHYNTYSLTTKRTPIGASNGTTSSNSFLPNSSSLYDSSSSVHLRGLSSSSYHRSIPHTYSPHCSSNRLISESAVTRFEHGLLSSTRNLPARPSPLALTSRSAGNSPPESPPTKDAISLIVEEKREKDKEFSMDCSDKNKGKENATDESSHEKIGNDLLEKRSMSPSRSLSPKNVSKPPRSSTPTKSHVYADTTSACASESPKSNSSEPIISSQNSQPSFGTQLEKMIKMSNFDQDKFQKHVCSAVHSNETRETEGVQEDRQTEKKSQKSTSEERKSPAEKRSPSAESMESAVKVGRDASELFQNPMEKAKAHSKSLSPAPNLRKGRKKKGAEERGSDVQTQGKRWARRARTVENLMDELQRDGMGHMTPEGKKQQFSSARNSPSKERSPNPKQQQHHLRAVVPPLLLITSPSMGGGDEDNLNGGKDDSNDGTEAEATAVLTLNATEGGDGEGDGEEGDYSGSSYDEDEEYSDEDYTDEEEWESDEGEWDEATVSRTLQLSGHESDFEFPFALGSSVADKPQSNVLAPPPIFTASISYDGMSDSWGGRSYSDEGTNSTSYAEPSGDEVEVGFTLVQQCAMRGSDEEFTSSTSGSYTSGTYSSSFDEDEEEEEEEEGEGLSDEEHASLRIVSPPRRSRSLASATSSSSSAGESAESVHSGEEEEKPEQLEVETVVESHAEIESEEAPLSLVLKSPSPMLVQMAVAQHAEEEEQSDQMLEEGHAMVEDLGGEELEMEELEALEEQSIDGSKEIRREETFVRAQELRDGRTEEATRPLAGQSKPRTDFAKKAVVQPMRQEKLSFTEQKTLVAPDEKKIREEEERKKREEEEKKRKMEEERKKREEEERKKREEEERKKREETEKKRKIEEERKKREEDERKKRETEEERKKREEEEKRKTENEKKIKMEEEKKRKAEQERKKKEEEEKKRETEEQRKKREEEEKKRKIKVEEEKRKNIKEEEERKKKVKEEEEKKRKIKEEEERKKSLSAEDKSAQRKSVLNMREEDRAKAEQAEKESARQKARATGAVEEKTKQYSTKTEEESLAYKRSKALEPKGVDGLKKRTFQPIQKPDPKEEDAFEKQMAELREQMRQGSRKLQSEFRDVSQGLKSASDEAKLKTKEEQHRTVMDKASSAFGKAEQEKRRQRELQESEAERVKREKEEKESKEREKREKDKKSVQLAQTTKPEPKRTVRRAAKETATPQSEDAKKGEEGTASKGPPKAKAYWERGTRRKTEELMKFKNTPTTIGQTKEEQTTTTTKKDQGEGKVNEQHQQTEQKQQQQKGEGQTESETKEKRANRRKNGRRNTRHGHRRRPFIRAPFDIDELMDWRGLDTFERMEAFFASRGTEKRPLTSPTNGTAPAAKRRGTEAQKVWISELRDIDKLYKASELRDIKLSAGA